MTQEEGRLRNEAGEMAYHITQFLTAIGLLYGKDSPEYEASGGTRTSEAGK